MISIPREPLVDPQTNKPSAGWLLGVFNKLTDIQFFSLSTAAGNVTEALPAVKSNIRTMLIFLKSTSDINTVSLTGGALGTVTLASQGSVAGFVNDGNSKWWQVLKI